MQIAAMTRVSLGRSTDAMTSNATVATRALQHIIPFFLNSSFPPISIFQLFFFSHIFLVKFIVSLIVILNEQITADVTELEKTNTMA